MVEQQQKQQQQNNSVQYVNKSLCGSKQHRVVYKVIVKSYVMFHIDIFPRVF